MVLLGAFLVMVGHSRSKNGVASLAYVPAISHRDAIPCQPKRDARHKAGHDGCGLELHAWSLIELGAAFAEIEKLALREAKNSGE